VLESPFEIGVEGYFLLAAFFAVFFFAAFLAGFFLATFFFATFFFAGFLAAFLATFFLAAGLRDFFAAAFFAADLLAALAPEDRLPVVALAIVVSPDDRLNLSAGEKLAKTQRMRKA
jgi:hypothetical protein